MTFRAWDLLVILGEKRASLQSEGFQIKREATTLKAFQWNTVHGRLRFVNQGRIERQPAATFIVLPAAANSFILLD